MGAGTPTRKEHAMTSDVSQQTVTDPVCGMKISPADAVTSIDHEGTTYYFCSQDCADSFRESPEDYV
jgi:Cu+-exporting ATPase